MIQSMTGYGKGSADFEGGKLTIELKSVNSRYLDLNIKSPKKLAFLETELRSYLKDNIARGKMDVFVALQQDASEAFSLKYNSEVARAYYENLQLMASDLSIDGGVRALDLTRFPEVFTTEETEDDEELLRSNVMAALSEAVKAFKASRETEGIKLREDLLSKLTDMEGYVSYIEQKSPEIVQAYKEKLREKITELLDETGVPLDENRFAMEVTLYADKVCVDEEIVRLKAHIDHVRMVLNSGDDIGKRLDFLAQEMNRESNTILSKCQNSDIADMGINLKTTIEKIREQIQNIE